ncbi:hypothetical protein Rsub_03691 [Raphidocelis subcapitata]|uniref:Uncharacterized protein n=1 Tax=Raphidocelis subcapitata TaxID=307507 RepID=A0A2V0P0W4_9CHLO|nr:hypothetical protein Rsub_03691 [Raphidocelis subcapitata]|eukprot:GBF90837.1 hypothetical protein Rsub_03691 [Raphidocelis subcapitata]
MLPLAGGPSSAAVRSLLARALASGKALPDALDGRWQHPAPRCGSCPGAARGLRTTPPAGGAAGELAAAALQLSAASPIETLGGGAGLNPIVLGTSVWELAHAATGLPWWASIPLTTLALRTALLPLTVKARGATVNFGLMRQAAAASRALWDRMQQEQQAAAVAGGGGGAAASDGKAMTRSQLTRQYLDYMRRQHATPSLWWYTANAFVQVNVFLGMSAALRHMSAVGWPGFESEGIAWFVDMTKPAVEWGTWATGYGVAGMFLPLAVFGAYIRTLEYSAVADRPRARAIMEGLTLPLFLAALVVPHATVLYWLANGTFALGLQAALSRPGAAAALGLPMAAVHARGEAGAAAKSEIERRQLQGLADASEDPAFVRYLAADTLARGQHAAAAAALKRLTALAPGDAAAWRQLGAACGRMGQWAAAGDAHARAGELLLAAAQRSSSSGGGGGGGGGPPPAAEAGAELVAGAVAYLNAASVRTADGSSGGGGGGGSGGAGAAKLGHVGRALELLHRAEADARVSDSDVWYYTAMGRLATGQLPAALDAAARSWQRAREAGGGGDGGGGEGAAAAAAAAAARLARPLATLCDKLASSSGGGGGGGQLLRAAELAAEVAAAAGPSSGEARAAVSASLRRAADAAAAAGRGDAAARLRELAGAAEGP